MKISLQWLKQYIDLPAGTTTEEIAHRLTFSGLEIEGIEKRSKGFEKVFIGKILERTQHPNADRLSLTKITLGGDEVLEIVCGAQNIKAGDIIPVATIGAHLPNGMEIKAAKIRNVASSGMLCSPEELCLPKPEGHTDGIYQLPEDAPLGKNFAEYLGLDDEILEVNVTPNRGDALSHIGVARDVAGLFGVNLKYPEVKSHALSGATVRVDNQVGDACPAYFARLIKGVKVGPSPEWLRKRIESIGQRSISNVVDATSFVLWEVGQPLHAFDAAKIKDQDGIRIQIRPAKQGEAFASLTGKDLQLDEKDLVIAAGTLSKTVALAGVVGGANSEVSVETVDVLLECADFNPGQVRKTNRRLALLTDAAYRFERGVDQSRIEWALNRATDIILASAGGEVQETAQSQETTKNLSQPKLSLRLRLSEVQKLLGKTPDLQTTMGLLRSIGIGAEVAAGEQNVLSVHVPGFRRDLRRTVDLIEEVARLWGYDKLDAKLPVGGISQEEGGRRAYFQVRRIRRHFTSLGFYEAQNYGFTSMQELKRVLNEQELVGTVMLANPLNEDFAVMKPTLLPGLLRSMANNVSHKREIVRLFEMRRVFRAKGPQDPVLEARLETGVKEVLQLGVVMTGLDGAIDWSGKVKECDFFSIKGALESVLQLLGQETSVQFRPGTSLSYFHPYQCAELVQGKRVLGRIGRLHPRVEKNYDLSKPVYALELELESLLETAAGVTRFKAFGRFPAVERDFSATVPNTVNAQMIRSLVTREAKPLLRDLNFFDVYKGSRVPEGHTSYAFRIVLSSDDHTLADKEIQDIQESIMKKMESEFGARFAGL
jgi:phenylalanyl-tRNA synthetase beta chain